MTDRSGNFSRLSVSGIAAGVAGGRQSAVQVAQEVLARVEAYEAIQPQTWIHRHRPEALLDQARRVDARLAGGEILPLAGVPYAVKDNIDVAGSPTTAGCPQFTYAPQASASVVAKLEAAGAMMIGKTNLDQFATGLVGSRSPYGACGCVYNLDYISGGSSSGSAVAVAAGLAAFALGTDTAGSGRVPAAINHLVGLKPTPGRWSIAGLAPACRSLDCITVFASSVDDACLVDALVAGFDPDDPYSREDPTPPDQPPISTLGVPRPDQLTFFGDAQSARLYAQAVERAAGLGIDIVEVDIAELLATARLLYTGPWVAERAEAAEHLLRTNPGALHGVVREIIQAGLGVTGLEVFKGQHALKTHQRAAAALWRSVDALLLPTTPTVYRIAEVLAEPLALNSHLGVYTNFVNLLDMSAIAMPAGFRDNRSGFGVTLLGPAFADRRLQQLARRYEAAAVIDPPVLDLRDRPAETVRLAVVGAHLAGMPLHWQLTSRDARLVGRLATAKTYKLYAMSDGPPQRPALVHVESGGGAIEVEVYELTLAMFGSFVAEVAAPLAIGVVTLADGTEVKGFIAEPRAMIGAKDITALGGWRAYLASP